MIVVSSEAPARALPEVVLASGSPRRRDLLRGLGVRLRVRLGDVDEVALPGRAPRDVAEHWAAAKADAVAALEPRELVIAADTVVDVDGDALGKPRDADEATAMLRRLSGREHLVHTAVVVVDGAAFRRVARTVTARVRFLSLHDDEIAAYVATGDSLDKAGAYGIQGRGATLVEAIEGDFYAVMGFPIAAFAREIRALGYRLPDATREGPA